VEGLGPRAGKKLMRVCDLFFAEKVLKIPVDIELCANSTMVKDILEQKLKRNVHLLVNGVNMDLFKSPDKHPSFPTTIGMFFYPKSYALKGMEEGFFIMKELKRRYGNLRFVVAGEKRKNGIPGFVEFRDAVRVGSLVDFYRSVDIFIFPGKYDACPNPPMEALACKCALVTTNVGGISDYTVPGATAMVSLPGDADTMLRNVVALIENPSLFQRLAKDGHEKIADFSTDRQGDILERILSSLLDRPVIQ
jgi:glycosyltransferase involved in cell wall biosynthesis